MRRSPWVELPGWPQGSCGKKKPARQSIRLAGLHSSHPAAAGTAADEVGYSFLGPAAAAALPHHQHPEAAKEGSPGAGLRNRSQLNLNGAVAGLVAVQYV